MKEKINLIYSNRLLKSNLKAIAFFVFGVFTIIPISAFSQSYSLNEAIDLGLKNRLEIKNQSLQIDIANGLNDKIRAQWKPKISAQADLRWNTQLQTTVLPFDITGKNADGTSTVKFGTPFNNSLGLQLDQKIFDPNKKIDLKINENEKSRQLVTLEQLAAEIKEQITTAYYTAILNKEKIKLSQDALDRAKVSEEEAEVQYKNGTLLQNDLDRFRLDSKNALLSHQRNIQELDISLANLKYLMNIQSDEEFHLSDNLIDIELQSQINLSPDFDNIPELKIEQTNTVLYELNQKKALAVNKPTISAYGNYSVLQLNNQFNPFSTGTWFPYNYLGVKFSIPIYDGKLAQTDVRENKIQRQISTNRQQILLSEYEYQSYSAMQKMTQVKIDKEQAEGNIALARQIYETDKFRFEKGVITYNDLKTTENTLQQSELNLYTAIYNYLLADLQYRKASAKF